MSITKTAVFIASKFDEFADLRAQLRTKLSDRHRYFYPIDLNDGRVSHRPPLEECLRHVRQSEFVILLLGDEYGTLAPGNSKSFTHLEYEEAIRDDSRTRVLVFCIGEHYRDRRFRFAASNVPLGAWQREIEKRHTVGFFDPETPVEDMAEEIAGALLAAFYELRFGQTNIDAEDQPRDLFDTISKDGSLDDSDIVALEASSFEQHGPSLVDGRPQFREQIDVLLRPAAVAAYEQREEAQRAIDLADYGCAIKHLQRAIELRPLDLMSNFWLATLYVSLGRKELCIRARELSERAARIALDEGALYRAAASYMLAARASRMTECKEDALAYARQAVDTAPRYAKARIELAKCLVESNVQADAMREIREAAGLYYPSLREVFIDPLFKPLRARTNALIEEIRVGVVRDARIIQASEREIAPIVGQSLSDPLPDSASRREAIDVAQASALKQHEWVQSLAANAGSALQRVSTSPDSDGSRLEDEWRELGELAENDSVLLAREEARFKNLLGPSAKLGAYWALGVSILVFLAAVVFLLMGRSFLAVLAAGLVCYLLHKGYSACTSYRRQLQSCRAGLESMKNRLSGYDARRTDLQTGVLHLRESAQQAAEAARHALTTFETTVLPRAIRLLPFRSLFTGEKGSFVRVLSNQVESFSQQSKREIEITQILPQWLEYADADNRPPAMLFRIDEVGPSKIRLNRARAYLRAEK